jgi:hypothetical protein
MRFFSNDKEPSDDRPDVDVRERADQPNPEQAQNDFPDRVQSDPVSVPQQRAGSPWLSAPENADTSDAELAAEERRDRTADTSDAGLAADERRDRTADAGRPPFHEPSAQPTAFGASTVGGAVAASATANPLNDPWPATDRDSAADSGVGDYRSGAPRDGVVNDEDDRLRPDDSAVRRDGRHGGPAAGRPRGPRRGHHTPGHLADRDDRCRSDVPTGGQGVDGRR